jgi:hypothetical protein
LNREMELPAVAGGAAGGHGSVSAEDRCGGL